MLQNSLLKEEDGSYERNLHSVRYKEKKSLISWSRNGFIAYAAATKNKYNLYLCYLESTSKGEWQFAKKRGIVIKPQVENSYLPDLTAITWSNFSTDLAVGDIYGNFYILLTGVKITNRNNVNGPEQLFEDVSAKPNVPNYELTSCDHMAMIYRDIIDNQTSGKFPTQLQIICIRWLNILKPFIINKPAILNSQGGEEKQKNTAPFLYTYGVEEYLPQGMSHPISSKQGCFVLRQSGELALYYQGEHKVEYHKITANLDFGATTTHIKHASIGLYSNTMTIVVAYDAITDNIRTFGIFIDWGYLLESALKQKENPHYCTPLYKQKAPTLKVRLLYEMRPAIELYSSSMQVKIEDDEMDVDRGSPNESSSCYSELSSIDMILRGSGIKNLDIIMCYEYFNEDLSTRTKIRRYALVPFEETISPFFETLPNNKASGHSKNFEDALFRLVLIDTLERKGEIQRIESNSAETLLILIYTNGGIEVIDREKMEVISGRSDFDTSAKNSNEPPSVINTLLDVGFDFPNIPAQQGGKPGPVMVAVSPSLSSIVYGDFNNKKDDLSFQVLKKNFEHISPQGLFITAVGFALRYSFTCYSNIYSDDLIALIQNEITRVRSLLRRNSAEDAQHIEAVVSKFVESIICESHKASNLLLDIFTKESADKLLSNLSLQRLSCLQMLLGELLIHDHLVSDVAQIILSLRCASFGIVFLLSNIYRLISKKKLNEETLGDSAARAECIMSLIGNIKWLVDLMIYLNQELLELSHSRNNLSCKINMSNSIVLPLTLGKVPRLFLVYALTSIARTHDIFKKLSRDLSKFNKIYPPMKEALKRYFSTFILSPLNLLLFENFLTECDNYITREQTDLTKKKNFSWSIKFEQKLVCRGEIPTEAVPIAEKVIDMYLEYTKKDVKVSEVYFYDVEWLQIGIFNATDTEVREHLSFQNQVISLNLMNYTVPRLQISPNECIDALRKIVIPLPSHQLHDRVKLRKCLRCRSYSLVSNPSVFESTNSMNQWTIVFQRTCVCGGSWVAV